MIFVGVAAVLALGVVIALVRGHIRGLEADLANLSLTNRRLVERLTEVQGRRGASQGATWPAPTPKPPPPPIPTPAPVPTPVSDPIAIAREVVALVSEGVERQAALMQESVRLAWMPQAPAPAAPAMSPMTGNPAVDAILSKYQSLGLNLGVNPATAQYNLPTPTMAGNHDFMMDPTDAILPSESGMPRHMDAAMIPMVQDDGGLDSLQNPTGIPGFQAGW